jgi:hypothetical protein
MKWFSSQAAVDIMEKEGANLADRPRSISVQETLSEGTRIVLGSRLRSIPDTRF